MEVDIRIKDKDACGRICKVEINGKKFTTPAFVPVVDPNVRKQAVSPKEIERIFKAKILMTSSYLIYKKRELRRRALEVGIHDFLGFDGVIITDSGAFQLLMYGEVEITNEEIVGFQVEIGSDIKVPLDIPFSPNTPKEEARRLIDETKRRILEAAEIAGRDTLMCPVHGTPYRDLLEDSAKFGADNDFKIFGVGSVVPFLASYSFRSVVDGVCVTRRIVPAGSLIHVFGAGHPIIFPLLVAMGADTFDSALYILFAREGKYLTPYGTRNIREMETFPCNCSVCSRYEPKELLEMDEYQRTRLLALHNLHVCFLEIKRIREAIHEERLWEYVIERCRSHPQLLSALRRFLLEHSDYAQRYSPRTRKRCLFYQGYETFLRPEVIRYYDYILNRKWDRKVAVVLPDVDEKPYEEHPMYKEFFEKKMYLFDVQFFFLSRLLSLIPIEVCDCYPCLQSMYPIEMEPGVLNEVKKACKNILQNFENVILLIPDKEYTKEGVEYEGAAKIILKEAIEELGSKITIVRSWKDLEDILSSFNKLDEEEFKYRKLSCMLEYWTGAKVPEEYLANFRIVESPATGRIRGLKMGAHVVMVVRAEDGIVFPRGPLAEEVLTKVKGRRIYVKEDAIPFIIEGRDLLAPGLLDASEDILPYDVAFFVDPGGNYLATAETLLSGKEMKEVKKGVVAWNRGR